MKSLPLRTAISTWVIALHLHCLFLNKHAKLHSTSTGHRKEVFWDTGASMEHRSHKMEMHCQNLLGCRGSLAYTPLWDDVKKYTNEQKSYANVKHNERKIKYRKNRISWDALSLHVEVALLRANWACPHTQEVRSKRADKAGASWFLRQGHLPKTDWPSLFLPVDFATCQRLTDLHSLYLLTLPHVLKAKTTNLDCEHATPQAMICTRELHMVHEVTAVSVIHIQCARHFFQLLQTFLVPLMLVCHQLAVKHQGENDEQNRSGDHDGRWRYGSVLAQTVEFHPAQEGDLHHEEQDAQPRRADPGHLHAVSHLVVRRFVDGLHAVDVADGLDVGQDAGGDHERHQVDCDQQCRADAKDNQQGVWHTGVHLNLHHRHLPHISIHISVYIYESVPKGSMKFVL